ncbi:hypothetical protein UNPA324_28225 [Bradyrhizobium sp. UNPA324]|nr:hypothetical protein UNPA324_28225 [Bradyrhizobium sp. UNPA324]
MYPRSRPDLKEANRQERAKRRRSALNLDRSLSLNRIFKARNVDIGRATLEQAWAWGFSGVAARIRRSLGPATNALLLFASPR